MFYKKACLKEQDPCEISGPEDAPALYLRVIALPACHHVDGPLRDSARGRGEDSEGVRPTLHAGH